MLVTIHQSLRRAIEAVTYDAVLETIRIADAAARRFAPGRPRIAVAGLNPHAGEGGLFGDEELRVIAPGGRGGARRRASTRAARSRPTPSSCARATRPAIRASSTSSSP